MKKLIFTLLALVGTMSMNAQIVELYKGDVLVAKYKASEVDNVVFKEGPAAPATTGTEKRTGDIDVNWVQLWKNGPKFAEYNVGATSATEYGGYYNWGKNTDKDTSDEAARGESVLTGANDTATNLWGSNWRMPTEEELQALLENCDVEWIDGIEKKYNDTNVTGLLCTGCGDYASNSVFLPAAGWFENCDLYDQSYNGRYWSSTPNGMYKAYYLGFDSNGQSVTDYYREIGRSVRAVLNEVVE